MPFIGSRIRIPAVFTQDTVAFDPTVVRFAMSYPNGNTRTEVGYTYGVGIQVIRTGVGLFYVEWLVGLSGLYRWRWESVSSTQECATQGEFSVPER